MVDGFFQTHNISYFLNINFHNATEKERKCCILISLAPYLPLSGGNIKGVYPPLFRTLLSFRPRIGVRGDITFPCHSALDAESGLWIPAPDQVEGMLSRE